MQLNERDKSYIYDMLTYSNEKLLPNLYEFLKPYWQKIRIYVDYLAR